MDERDYRPEDPVASDVAPPGMSASDDSPEEKESARRRKREPFRGMEPVSASDAALHGRDLSTKSQIKQIRKAGIRHEGKKVVTDDVKKLKSLAVTPEIPAEERIHYYVEPVRIEYYIPKESRFAVETRYLYIPLVDPEPRENHVLLAECMREDRFFDLMEIMNGHPEHITSILESYAGSMDLFESLSRAIREAEEDPTYYRNAFYICEVLAEKEPTLAALEFLGDFIAWDLNWLCRTMSGHGIEYYASDKTVSYFIKLWGIYQDEHEMEPDERFEILAALFYEQAFPNRGMEMQDEDFFFDIFDRK